MAFAFFCIGVLLLCVSGVFLSILIQRHDQAYTTAQAAKREALRLACA